MIKIETMGLCKLNVDDEEDSTCSEEGNFIELYV